MKGGIASFIYHDKGNGFAPVITLLTVIIGFRLLLQQMYCCIWRSLLYRKQQLFLAQTPSYKGEEPATVKPQQEVKCRKHWVRTCGGLWVKSIDLV